MSNTLIYYVYAYINKTTGKPYYIGKGKGDRAYSKNHKVSVPKDKSKIVFLGTNLSEVGAFALERRMISWWGRKDLALGVLQNKADGGEGATGQNPSNEIRAKMSASQKGKPKSKEHKAKISIAKKGKPGIPRSEETKANLSMFRKGKKHSDETITKLRKPKTEEHKTKLSVALKGKIGHSWSEETKAKRSAANIGKTKIVIDGVEYPGIIDVTKIFDIPRHTVYSRLKSKKWNWHYAP